MSLSNEQIERRKSLIGASEVAAVLGLNPYRGAFDVWARFHLPTEEIRAPDDAPDAPQFIRWGEILEAPIADEYARRERVELRRLGDDETWRHPTVTGLGGHPDRLVVEPGSAKVARGLEVKTAGWRVAHRWGSPVDDVVPDEYRVQCAAYMAIGGIDRWDLAVLIAGSDYRCYRLTRDETLEAAILEGVQEFWARHVVGGERPPIASSPQADQWLRRLFPRAKAPMIDDAPPALRDLARAYDDARAKAKAAETDLELAAATLREAIGDAEGFRWDRSRVTWRNNGDGQRVDYDAILREAGVPDDLVAKHTRTTPGARVLRVTIRPEE